MLTKCPSCGKTISVKRAVEQSCPKCGTRIHVGDPVHDEKNRIVTPEKSESSAAGKTEEHKKKTETMEYIQNLEKTLKKDQSTFDTEGVPWDRIPQIGFLDALFQTAREVILRPVPFFRNMVAVKGYKFIPLFGIMFAVIGSLFKTFWSLYIIRHYMPYIEPFIPPETLEKITVPGTSEVIVQILFTPIVLIMLSAVILFGISLLFGAQTKIHHFYRLIGFISVIDLLYIIPLVGHIVVFVWQSILIIRGISVINRFSHGRSLLVFGIHLVISVTLLLPLFSGV